MKLPTLSVIVPNYNHGHHLPASLDAMLNQTVQPHEIIVIDDGSTDNSVAIMEEIVSRHPQIKFYRNEKNCGVLRTLNRGIGLATGDFISAFAADDEVMPGFFEKSLSLLAEHPTCNMSGTICYYIDTKTGASWYLGASLSDKPRYFNPDEVVTEDRAGRLQIATGTMLVRRESFLEAGEYLLDLRWHADWFVMYVVIFRAGVCFVPEPLTEFRIFPASFSNKGRFNFKEQSAVLRRTLEYLEDPKYADVAPKFRASGILATFGKEMFWLLLTDSRYRKYLNLSFLRRVIPMIVKVEARKILPKGLANFLLKIGGFKKLPKKKDS